jgi:hypothetical protein
MLIRQARTRPSEADRDEQKAQNTHSRGDGRFRSDYRPALRHVRLFRRSDAG